MSVSGARRRDRLAENVPRAGFANATPAPFSCSESPTRSRAMAVRWELLVERK
jgi:hypothetical protein